MVTHRSSHDFITDHRSRDARFREETNPLNCAAGANAPDTLWPCHSYGLTHQMVQHLRRKDSAVLVALPVDSPVLVLLFFAILLNSCGQNNSVLPE